MKWYKWKFWRIYRDYNSRFPGSSIMTRDGEEFKQITKYLRFKLKNQVKVK